VNRVKFDALVRGGRRVVIAVAVVVAVLVIAGFVLVSRYMGYQSLASRNVYLNR